MMQYSIQLPGNDIEVTVQWMEKSNKHKEDYFSWQDTELHIARVCVEQLWIMCVGPCMSVFI